MMRSMFSGVSGIIAHQTKMDVIGNNISNVNTLGFKSSRVTFQEVFSQTLRGSGAPDAATGRGGTNPMQVGLGIAVSAVDTVTSRGSTQRTDNPTDLSIDGEGFFIVKGTTDSGYKFTRAGNFTLDKSGNLVTPGGLNVYGWQDYSGTVQSDGTYKFDTEKLVEPINLYSDKFNGNKKVINAMPSKSAEFSGNLRSSIDRPAETTIGAGDFYREDNIAYSVPFTAYDSLGNANKVKVDFWKTPTTPTTPLTPDVATGTWLKYDKTTSSYVAASDPVMTTWHWNINGGDNLTSANSGEVTFYSNGEAFYYVNSDGNPINVDGMSQSDINELQLTRKEPATVNPTIDLLQKKSNGAENLQVKLDFGKLTQFSSDSSAKTTSVDGYASGTLITFSTGADGILTGIYSNGQQQPLGMVGLASFQNPADYKKQEKTFICQQLIQVILKMDIKLDQKGLAI